MLPGSLLARLALGVGLGVTLLWLATSAITAAILRHEMDEVFDSALQETAQRILPLAVSDIISRDEEGISQRIASLGPHEEYFTYLVRDDQGRILLRSHSANAADFPPFEAIGFDQTDRHRLYSDMALQGTVTITIAEPLTHRTEVAHDTQLMLALPLLALIPLSLIGIWLLVRQTLRPVTRFSAAIATRGSNDLAPLQGAQLPDEIRPVAHAVNQLLQRLHQTLEAERSFTANAAHELRTPLAAALAQTQRLIAETDGGGAEGGRALQIEASLKRLNRLSEKLMQLARAEGGRMCRPEQADVLPILKMLLSEFTSPEDRARLLPVLPDTPVLSNIDPDAFAILGRNLIENALKHSPPGTPVHLHLTPDGVLRVINEGPPIATGKPEALTARFERGQTTADGSGLGLSIVRAIGERSGGRLELLSPASGRQDGFEVAFHLPTDTQG